VRTTAVRDRIALVAAAIALLGGILSLAVPWYDTGIQFAVDGDRLRVEAVDSLSQGYRDGIRPGMIVVSFNGQQLLRLPSSVYAESDPDHPEAEPAIIGVDPSVPTPVVPINWTLEALRTQPVEDLTVITPEALDRGSADNWEIQSVWYPGVWTFYGTRLALIPGLAILFGGAWLLWRRFLGAALEPLALPLATAVATPFLVLPLAAIGSFWAVAIAGTATTLAMLPLAIGLIERIELPDDRRLMTVGVGVIGVAAIVTDIAGAYGYGLSDLRGTLRWVLNGMIPLLPGLVAAAPFAVERLRGGAGRTRAGVLQSTELALAGATPLMAIGSDRWPYLWPFAMWLIGIVLAARFTVRPLARAATRATLQRDLVVAATEAERARLAADIHDDALQELTLLVRRLESSGDTEGAEIGRTVADRLRAICGDLRLPILDDLGVGPALDWLVLRIERLAGGEVRLERADDVRHSPDVELAIFRVAQEALANAVKHGKPPIVVRYRSTPAGISLAVDDAGPGIDEDAPETAEQAGRFGLLNMAQRAEQIGAILDVRRWPGGGTHVALEWRPR
jgi:signal transduction histidine kinase